MLFLCQHVTDKGVFCTAMEVQREGKSKEQALVPLAVTPPAMFSDVFLMIGQTMHLQGHHCKLYDFLSSLVSGQIQWRVSHSG